MEKIYGRRDVDVKITKVNENYSKIDSDDSGLLIDLSDRFKFLIKNHRYNPRVKNKTWDGYIRLFNLKNQLIYEGLLYKIIEYLDEAGYSYEFYGFDKVDVYNQELIEHILKNLIKDNFSFSGSREYMRKGIENALKNNRSLCISATRSGKSLIMFVIALYYSIVFKKRVLIVVPSSSLVEQMYDDFCEYFNGNEEELKESMFKIYSGARNKKEGEKKIVITTWQSAKEKDKDWFNQFSTILGDEVHEWEAKSLKNIIENCINVKFRHGFTGSLSKNSNTDSMALIGMFGEKMVISKTHELQKSGVLPQMNIYCIHLKYHDREIKSEFTQYLEDVDGNSIRKLISWSEESKKLFEINERMNFIINLIMKVKGNSLVMYNLIEEQGKVLETKLKSIADKFGKKVFYIDGSVKVEDRKKMKAYAEKHNNVILITSYGTFKRGETIKNVHHVFFPIGFKADTTTIQSIGRGLSFHKDKKISNFYDFGDQIVSVNGYPNYTFKHFRERIGIYKKEKYKMKLLSYDVRKGKITKNDKKR